MHRRSEFLKIILWVALLMTFVACRHTTKTERSEENTSLSAPSSDTVTNKDKVNVTQPGPAENAIEYRNNKGIGPIDQVDLAPQIDQEMVKNGEELFQNHCASCHRIHENAMGPGLGNVLERRSPEFVMNLILNTNEMLEKSPVMKSLQAEYEERMIQVDVTEEEARDIVEYLRLYQ